MPTRIALIVPLIDNRTKQKRGWMGWKRPGDVMLPTADIDDMDRLESSVITLAGQCGLLTNSSSWKKVQEYQQFDQRTVWFELNITGNASNGACLPDPQCMPTHIETMDELSLSWQKRDLADIMNEHYTRSTRQLFVTTALPYANANFHMGHIMEYTQADIWVRFQRMQGNLVHFVCADDAHGAPIMLAAEKEGLSPHAFVEKISNSRPAYLQAFHICFDHWHSTDGIDNHEMSKAIYRSLRDKNLIATKSVDQFFDTQKEMFLPDRFIKGQCPNCGALDQYGDSCESCSSVYTPIDLINPYSVLSHTTPVRKSSEHYFFKLSDPRCVEFLESYVHTKGLLQSEVLNKIKEWFTSEEDDSTKLKDWDISRDAPYFGIEIPDAPGKFFYVWLDAPVGYLASLKHYFDSGKARLQGDHRTYQAFMSNPEVEQIHFIGKDITYFHTLFWPAMLKFSDQKLPDNIYVHGFMTVNGRKMSKSRGTGIDPMKYIELGLQADHLRYYLASKLTSKVEDVDFNPIDFTTKVNGDLIGKYINIASRSAGFLNKRFENRLTYTNDDAGKTVLELVQQRQAAIRDAYDRRDFASATKETLQAVDAINAYIDQQKPWELAKNPDQQMLLHQVCSTCIEAFRILSIYLKPIIPGIVEKVEAFLQIQPLNWDDVHQRLGKHQISVYSHLSQRIQLEDVLALFENQDIHADAQLTSTTLAP